VHVKREGANDVTEATEVNLKARRERSGCLGPGDGWGIKRTVRCNRMERDLFRFKAQQLPKQIPIEDARVRECYGTHPCMQDAGFRLLIFIHWKVA
jgi:hypothetical protein